MLSDELPPYNITQALQTLTHSHLDTNGTLALPLVMQFVNFAMHYAKLYPTKGTMQGICILHSDIIQVHMQYQWLFIIVGCHTNRYTVVANQESLFDAIEAGYFQR